MGFKYRKRTFLALAPDTSYILAEVESSKNGEYKVGHNMLTIADCRRHVELEFFLGTKKARKQSLTAINLLIETLVHFGHSLAKEAELIEAFEKAVKSEERNNARVQKARNGKDSKRVRKNAQRANRQ